VGALQQGLSSPLGAWAQVNEEIARRIEALIHHGELTADEGARLRQKLIGQVLPGREAADLSDAELERALAERGVPTREDLQRLMTQIEALSAELDKVNQREKPNRSRRTKRGKTKDE
jgi:polyhydroxyalkanoate synthesis regulator phasin